MNSTLELLGAATSLAIQKESVNVDQLDTAKPLVEIFAPYQTTLEKWEAKAKSLVVSDIGQVAEMKMARVARLELRAARIGMDKTRLGLVENLKARTSKIDGTARIIREKIEGLEAILLESEEFAERHAAKLKAELKFKREAEVMPLLDSIPLFNDLSDLSDAAYQKYLGDLKLLRQAKIDAAAKAEADRLAKEAADKAERERIAAENAKLKEIAVEMERKAAIERQHFEAEQAKAKAEADETARLAEIDHQRLVKERQEERYEAELKRQAEVAEQKRLSEIERKRVEAERAKEKAEADARWQKAEAQRMADLDKARKDREAIQAEAEEIAKKARMANSKLRDELAAKAKAEAVEKARIEAERVEKEQEARRAAAAPDKAKLQVFVTTLRGVGFPALKNSDLANEVNSKFNALIFWLESMIEQ